MTEQIHNCRICGVILTDSNSTESRMRNRNWICRKCAFQHKNWIEKNPEKWNKIQRKAQRKIRLNIKLEVLRHYGGNPPKCACCNEMEVYFLSINHINGGGTKHREIVGSHLYEWLIKNNFPSGFEVLCYNCNLAKGFFGICPHQKRLNII